MGKACREIAPKKAFALAVENLKQHVFGGVDCDPQWSEILDRLTTDILMQGVWENLNGDEKSIEGFIFAVFSNCAMVGVFDDFLFFGSVVVRNIDDIRGEHDRLSCELRGLEGAIDVLSRYRATTKEFPQHLRGLEPMLQELGSFAHSRADRRRAQLARWLPTSRKSRVDFLVSVHLPGLMVRDMIRLFGQPHYQMVADTINVLFKTEEFTAGRVRDAFRRHKVGYSSPS